MQGAVDGSRREHAGHKSGFAGQTRGAGRAFWADRHAMQVSHRREKSVAGRRPRLVRLVKLLCRLGEEVMVHGVCICSSHGRTGRLGRSAERSVLDMFEGMLQHRRDVACGSGDHNECIRVFV